MPIHFECPDPNCRRKLNAPEELSGRRVRCPKCKKALTVPECIRTVQPDTTKLVAIPGIAQDVRKLRLAILEVSEDVSTQRLPVLKGMGFTCSEANCLRDLVVNRNHEMTIPQLQQLATMRDRMYYPRVPGNHITYEPHIHASLGDVRWESKRVLERLWQVELFQPSSTMVSMAVAIRALVRAIPVWEQFCTLVLNSHYKDNLTVGSMHLPKAFGADEQDAVHGLAKGLTSMCMGSQPSRADYMYANVESQKLASALTQVEWLMRVMQDSEFPGQDLEEQADLAHFAAGILQAAVDLVSDLRSLHCSNNPKVRWSAFSFCATPFGKAGWEAVSNDAVRAKSLFSGAHPTAVDPTADGPLGENVTLPLPR